MFEFVKGLEFEKLLSKGQTLGKHWGNSGETNHQHIRVAQSEQTSHSVLIPKSFHSTNITYIVFQRQES